MNSAQELVMYHIVQIKEPFFLGLNPIQLTLKIYKSYQNMTRPGEDVQGAERARPAQ